jgi:hypothetical protein
MDRGVTERDILEKKLDKRLQDPKTEPSISLPLYFFGRHHMRFFH